MFYKIFSTKARKFFLKRSNSTKYISLNGKKMLRHCRGHNTIVLLISIERWKETTKRLYFDHENARIDLSWLFDWQMQSWLFFFLMIHRVDEFLVATCEKSIWFCECPRYCFWLQNEKKTWLVSFCLFYGDMFTFCHEFNDLTSRCKIFKMF